MKYQKILGLVATAGLLLAGCATDSDNNSTWLSDPNAVHVSASVGNTFTRSNPAAADEDAGLTSFNENDVMGVSNNGTSITYTFDGTDWQPGSGNYLVWDKSDLKFQCWYPADGNNTFSKGYVQEDQSSAKEIAKSDYMAAAVTDLADIPGNRQLNVKLERKTARLIFNIQSFNDQFDASTKINHVRVLGDKDTDANDTYAVYIKPLQNGDGGIGTTYTALVAPGSADGLLYFSDSYEPLKVHTKDLEAGKSYTYNLIVGKNKIVVGDVTVADWQTGKVIPGTANAQDNTPYVTFSAPAEQTFKMECNGGYQISNFEYSVDFGDWKEVKANEGVIFGGKNGGLRLRGNNVNGTASSTYYFSTITFTDANVKVACTGDIRTLLAWDKYRTVDTKDAKFCNLFENCTALTSAPELPAETLKSYCYYYMFYGCSSLEVAPELPAEILTYACYNGMFANCSSLQTAPKLPAETLAGSCYEGMFTNCSSLKVAPKQLPATELADCCYSSMFAGCEDLTIAPELPATTLVYNCYDQMFNGCTKLSSITILAPSDQISRISFSNSYSNWTSNAGTDTSVKSRTLKVQDRDAYNVLVAKELDENWKIGKCKVLDKDGNEITEQ